MAERRAEEQRLAQELAEHEDESALFEDKFDSLQESVEVIDPYESSVSVC